MKKNKVSNLIDETHSNIRNIKQYHNISKSNQIIGVNYLLATIQVVNEMDSNIFLSDDHFENEGYNEDGEIDEYNGDYDTEYIRGIGLSRKFLLARTRRLNALLRDFNNPKEPLSHNEIISRREKELSDYLFQFEIEDKINWLNKNGLYSFYNGVKQGYITYEELGKRVEKIIELEHKKLKSNQQ